MVSATSGEVAQRKAKQKLDYPASSEAGFLVKSKFQIIEKMIEMPKAS